MTGPANPAPRPALRKAPDGAVHPASPRLAPVVAEPPRRSGAVRPKGALKAAARGAEGADDKVVEIAVPIPKSMRKRLRRKAEEYGYSAEEATYHLIRVWLDG